MQKNNVVMSGDRDITNEEIGVYYVFLYYRTRICN